MDHRASPSAPARRTQRIALVVLAMLGAAFAGFVLRPSLVASAPSGSSPVVGQATTVQTAPDETPAPLVSAPPGPPADIGQPTGRRSGLQVDGVIPDGMAVSVFDREVPAVGGLDAELLAALQRAATEAEADGIEVRVNSGWRSPEHQQRLLQDAVDEYGSEAEAARWVATPETSAHVSGEAVDIGPPDAAAWLSDHGAAHGLCQVYGNEPWHFELRPDAVEQGCPPMYADPTEDPRMQP